MAGVARAAQAAAVPCVLVAGESGVGTREAAANGIDEGWSIAEAFGSGDAGLAAGTDGVRRLGREVARSWAR